MLYTRQGSINAFTNALDKSMTSDWNSLTITFNINAESGEASITVSQTTSILEDEQVDVCGAEG